MNSFSFVEKTLQKPDNDGLDPNKDLQELQIDQFGALVSVTILHEVISTYILYKWNWLSEVDTCSAILKNKKKMLGVVRKPIAGKTS
jgi:hypothetical protein